MTHRTHKTRFSDSSLYDEVCTECGAVDGDGLGYPCPKAADTLEKACRELVVHVRQKNNLEPGIPLSCPIMQRIEKLL